MIGPRFDWRTYTAPLIRYVTINERVLASSLTKDTMILMMQRG